MHLPGFTAEVSVYESFHFYRGILASAIGGEVQPQQTKGCGPCYIHANGKCAKDCVIPGREFVTLSGQRMRRLRPVHMHKKLCRNGDPLLRGPVGTPG
jgi:hypothetical protein